MTNSFITSFNNFYPRLESDVWVDISARIVGKVSLAQGVTVWPGAVLRADDEEIIIGQGSAILDLCLLEAPFGNPVIIESDVLISHQATLHGAIVKSRALVGIGAIVLDGAVLGEESLIGAGGLVPPGMQVPSGWLMLGQPVRPIRKLTSIERSQVIIWLKELRYKAAKYSALL